MCDISHHSNTNLRATTYLRRLGLPAMALSKTSDPGDRYTNAAITPQVLKQSHPSPSAFAHVVLRTTEDNYQSMVDFYLDMLQAEIILEADFFAMLRYDDEHHRVAIVRRPEITPQEASPFTAGCYEPLREGASPRWVLGFVGVVLEVETELVVLVRDRRN